MIKNFLLYGLTRVSEEILTSPKFLLDHHIGKITLAQIKGSHHRFMRHNFDSSNILY